jgi:pectate lyase
MDLNHFRIENVGDGINPSDAVNVAQVGTLLAGITKGDKGDPGGDSLSIGTLAQANTLAIPAGVDLVKVAGTSTVGDEGTGREFVYNVSVDSTYVADNPSTSFLDLNGRGFKEVSQWGDRATSIARGRKTFARTWAEAETMAQDLSEMEGYAAYANVTGGQGHSVIRVWNSSDSDLFEGSLRYAVKQATADGGGIIVFAPTGSFEIKMASLLNITGSNITIDAPGRNVRIGALKGVEMFRLTGDNIIFRRISQIRYPSTIGTEKDAVWIRPDQASDHKHWISECSFSDNSDGAIDISSSTLDITGNSTYVTVSNCVFRNQAKTMAIGSTMTSIDPAPAWAPTALAQPAKIFVTDYQNYFEGAAERSPRVGALAFVHSVNNVHDLVTHHNEDGTTSAIYGMWATTGGKILVEGDLFRLASPSSGASATLVTTDAWDDTSNVGPGALKAVDCVSNDSLVINQANQASVPVPPYSLAHTTPSAEGTLAQDQWADDIINRSGASVAGPTNKKYLFVEKAVGDAESLFVDGDAVLRTRGGYLVKVEDDVKALDFSSTDPSLVLKRGSTETISGGSIDLTDLTNSFITVDTEGAAAADDLDTITSAGTDGQILLIRAVSSARVVTVKNTGNIRSSGDVILNDPGKVLVLIYDTGTAKWGVIAYPVVVPTVPTLASGTFTPTLTGIANCSGLAVTKGTYQRNGNIVTGSLIVTGTQTTSSTLTQLEFTLPVTSDLGTGDLCGLCCTNSAAPISGYVNGINATDRGRANFVCSSAFSAAFTLSINFQYVVN